MIYELQPDKFPLIKELHNEMDFDLLTPTIVEGKIAGRIWVNNPEKPSTALVWDEHYSFVLLGDDSNQSFNSYLELLFADTIIPDALSREFREGWIECAKRWGKKIEQNELLPNLFPMHHAREHYAIHQSTGLRWAEKIPPGLSLNKIEDKILKRADLGNVKTLLDMINVRWKSVENFLRWGFGFILLQDATIVSYCLSLGNGNGRCDIEIETIEGHQRQGYGAIITAAFVDHALAHGYTEIGWDAFAGNVPSVQLALKLGFKKQQDHICYSGWYNALDRLLVKAGWMLSELKNYKEAASLYEEAFKAIKNETPEIQSSYLFNTGIKGRFYYYAAKAYAASRNKAAALQKLQKALDQGWQDIERFLNDEDLKVLHHEKAWDEIIENMKQSLDN